MEWIKQFWQNHVSKVKCKFICKILLKSCFLLAFLLAKSFCLLYFTTFCCSYAKPKFFQIVFSFLLLFYELITKHISFPVWCLLLLFQVNLMLCYLQIFFVQFVNYCIFNWGIASLQKTPTKNDLMFFTFDIFMLFKIPNL